MLEDYKDKAEHSQTLCACLKLGTCKLSMLSGCRCYIFFIYLTDRTLISLNIIIFVIFGALPLQLAVRCRYVTMIEALRVTGKYL